MSRLDCCQAQKIVSVCSTWQHGRLRQGGVPLVQHQLDVIRCLELSHASELGVAIGEDATARNAVIGAAQKYPEPCPRGDEPVEIRPGGRSLAVGARRRARSQHALDALWCRRVRLGVPHDRYVRPAGVIPKVQRGVWRIGNDEITAGGIFGEKRSGSAVVLAEIPGLEEVVAKA